MATSGRDLVQRLHDEVWIKRDSAVLDELCAPDCKFYDPMQGDGPTDLAGYKQTMARFDQSFVVDDCPVDRIVVEAGDSTVFLWRLTAHMKGGDQGRTGRTSGMGLIQVRGGRIVEHRSVWDTLKFFQGLGMVPALGMPAADTGERSTRPGV
jgi:ketosteroid isomerase-like protein